MQTPIVLFAVASIAAAGSVLGAPEPLKPQPGAPAGEAIKIDPRGLSGGAGGDLSGNAGLVVVDPLSGNANVLAPQATPQTLQPGVVGQNAAAIPTAPTTLDPAPRLDAYPYCRDRNDGRCRAR